MTRLAKPWLIGVALLLLATVAHAQPLEGTGCRAAGPVVGPAGIKTPGSAVYGCPTTTPGAAVMLIGGIGQPVALPNPPACSPGRCVLGCNIVITVPVPANGLTINAPSVPGILPLCFQCVAIDTAASCVWLSRAVKITLLPC